MAARLCSALVLVVAMVSAGSGAGTPARAREAPNSNPVIGLHIPWAIGGPRIEPQGTLVLREPEWPAYPVRAVRLWDTRTAWLNLEPEPDRYDWSNLDRHVDQARTHGTTDITLVLWGTPRWAALSESTGDAAWLGPGSAAPPRELGQWREFVRDVASRYRGLITAYQIGNEVNEPAFWRGTADQLGTLVSTAVEEIRRADPAARIIGPSVAVTSGTRAELSQVIDFWGAVQTAGVRLDAIAAHWYPAPNAARPNLAATLTRLRAAARASGWGRTPLWITEAGHRASKATPAHAIALLRHSVRELQRSARSTGTVRLYWYAWTDAHIGDLIPMPADVDPVALMPDAAARFPR